MARGVSGTQRIMNDYLIVGENLGHYVFFCKTRIQDRRILRPCGWWVEVVAGLWAASEWGAGVKG